MLTFAAQGGHLDLVASLSPKKNKFGLTTGSGLDRLTEAQLEPGSVHFEEDKEQGEPEDQKEEEANPALSKKEAGTLRLGINRQVPALGQCLWC